MKSIKENHEIYHESQEWLRNCFKSEGDYNDMTAKPMWDPGLDFETENELVKKMVTLVMISSGLFYSFDLKCPLKAHVL